LGGLTSQLACVSGFSGSGRSAVPSRGCRLSWASSPSDRHGTAGIGAGGGLMVSPHGSRALQAARTDLSPLAHPSGHDFRRGPVPPSIGERLLTSSYRQSLFSKNRSPIAATVPLRTTAIARCARVCDLFARQRVRHKTFFRERWTPQSSRMGNRVRSARTRPGIPGRARRKCLSGNRCLRAPSHFSR
jgi:hypothetical protein